jgi:hypothetical protein
LPACSILRSHFQVFLGCRAKITDHTVAVKARTAKVKSACGLLRSHAYSSTVTEAAAIAAASQILSFRNVAQAGGIDAEQVVHGVPRRGVLAAHAAAPVNVVATRRDFFIAFPFCHSAARLRAADGPGQPTALPSSFSGGSNRYVLRA